MKRLGLTTLSLLCVLATAVGTDFGPPIGSRFRSPGLPLGSKGTAILFDASEAQTLELELHREAFRKLGVALVALHGASPGWFVLDPRGLIVAKYLDGRYTSAAILVHQFGWTPPEPGVEVQGKQLTATVGASNSKVSPGEVVALTLDIDLGPGMHVYAPGVEGYIPIDWKMEDTGAVQVRAPVFPHAEKLFLKAIGETVPAYRRHFRLIRDITVADGSGQFTVDGALRYQACDDRLCYIPQTLRLHWTFERP